MDNFLLELAAVHIQRIDDASAAVEQAFGACAIEEDALFALLQTELHWNSEELLKGRPIWKAQLKAKLVDIARNGPSAEKCRKALKEGRKC